MRITLQSEHPLAQSLYIFAIGSLKCLILQILYNFLPGLENLKVLAGSNFLNIPPTKFHRQFLPAQTDDQIQDASYGWSADLVYHQFYSSTRSNGSEPKQKDCLNRYRLPVIHLLV